MKKVFVSLLLGAMSCLMMMAQKVEIYKNGKFVASYSKSDGYDIRYSTGSATTETHDYVDLGLPSGTLWATCNVGANSPERCGTYFAWGETTQKDVYDWTTYKHGVKTPSSVKFTKYYKSGALGTPDNKMVLETKDDAATILWGTEWKTPSSAQMEELYKNCYFEWTDNYKKTGIKGRIVYKVKDGADKGLIGNFSRKPAGHYTINDAHIFLPATGCYDCAQMDKLNSVGYYWTSTLYNLYSTDANRLQVMAGGVSIGNASRYYGYSIRPVHK